MNQAMKVAVCMMNYWQKEESEEEWYEQQNDCKKRELKIINLTREIKYEEGLVNPWVDFLEERNVNFSLEPRDIENPLVLINHMIGLKGVKQVALEMQERHENW